MVSFRKFLTENSVNSKNYSYDNYDNYLYEEFRTDEQGIKQLQAREYELTRKMSPIREKIRELESKHSSLMYRIAGMVTNLMNAHETGEKYPQVEKGYEEAKKELEKIDKELDSLYAKIRPYEDELAKIRSAVDKLVIRNAKKAGLHPYEYVSKYDLFDRLISRRRMNEARANKDGKFVPKNRKQLDKLVKDESIHLGDIDVSNINDFSKLFSYSFRKDFSGIEKWDVSHVIAMNSMFLGAKYFNEPIGHWDVSKVVDMEKMFSGCINFNQDISRWNVSNVVSMSEMFNDCEKFNQRLDKWDVRNVRDFWRMFHNAKAFNKDLNSWTQKNKKIDFSSMFE